MCIITVVEEGEVVIDGGETEDAGADCGVEEAIRAAVVEALHGNSNGVIADDAQKVINPVGDVHLWTTVFAIELQPGVSAVFGSGFAIIERISYICQVPTLD